MIPISLRDLRWWVGGFRTKQEAKRARDKARSNVSYSLYINPPKISFEDLLKDRDPVVTETTYAHMIVD